MNEILSVRNLEIDFKTSRGVHKALRNVSFDVKQGEVFGVVGETGCGKTITGLSILRLLPKSATARGEILFENKNLLSLSDKEMNEIRGRRIAMIFQDPTSSLNPVFTIGEQILRVIRQHLNLDAKSAFEQAHQSLDAVGLPDAKRVMSSYPHQLSGGQQQRVMIAMALACRPSLLIADEPTTALDVTIQAQILNLLRDLQKKFDLSIILVTHNLGVVAQVCDRMAVLYAGSVAEISPTYFVYESPHHPYSKGLLDAIPRPDRRGSRMSAIPGTVPADPGGIVGCPFAPRCASAFDRCSVEMPLLKPVGELHESACFLPVEPSRP
ncbi:MAG: ABC transporter ATP-binding protein [Chloroflexi bacterium]|nr:ABC transporter ATP-binding protein [Chloroflexota bacterium]